MINRLFELVVTEDYLKHLRKVEKRIPFSEYGAKNINHFLISFLKQKIFTILHKYHIHKSVIMI